MARWERSVKSSTIELNFKKTEVLEVNRTEKEPVAILDGYTFNNVTPLKYMGVSPASKEIVTR